VTNQKLENLAVLLIDDVRIACMAAALVRPDDEDPPDSAEPRWSLLVTEPDSSLPSGEMSVLAVSEEGAIYAGRGRWKLQRASQISGHRTHIVEGIEDLRVGSVTDLDDGAGT
jgi:hypothetical protein